MGLQFKIMSIFTVCLFIVGCYTIISHPDLSDDVTTKNDYIDNDVSHIDECSQCHENYDEFLMPYTDTYHSFNWEEYDYHEWQYYYDIPWWQEDRYYISVSDEERNKSPLPPTQKRSVQRRGSSGSRQSVSSPTYQPTPSHLSKKSSSSSSENESETIQQSSTKKPKRTVGRRQSKSNERRKKPSSSEKKEKKE